MTDFILPITDGKPLEIVDFKIDLLASPPEIKEGVITGIDHYVSTQEDAIKIIYKDAPTNEGHLNIYLCKFKTGKCRLHIFGKIKGTEFRTEKELSLRNQQNSELLIMRIKHVLMTSRNILRNYYLNANTKSIENHLMAFIIAS